MCGKVQVSHVTILGFRAYYTIIILLVLDYRSTS